MLLSLLTGVSLACFRGVQVAAATGIFSAANTHRLGRATSSRFRGALFRWIFHCIEGL